MNYYTPGAEDNMAAEGEIYAYTVAEVVGWRNQGRDIGLRMGAPGWGFKGYGYVPADSNIIHQLYSIKLLGYEIKTE